MTQQDQPTATSVPSATLPSNPFTDEFKKYTEATLEAWRCSGMSISIIDGEEIFSESFGYAALPNTKATSDTLWYSGSCTKAYTGALLAQMIADKAACPALADKGWSTTMASVIRDDFVLQDEWATNHATVEDAASHHTGMGRHDMALLKEIVLPDGSARPATHCDHVRQMRHLAMGDEPRRRFIYSNHAYMALSHLLETAVGRPLGDALHERIWRPLGMESTYMGDEEAIPGMLATGYGWDAAENRYVRLPAETVTAFQGTGAAVSTVADAAKWLRCLLSMSAPLSAPAHADIRKPRVILNPTPAVGADITTYGLGWTRTVYRGQPLYAHSGATMTQGCEMCWLPGLGFGFVAAGNAHRASNLAARSLAYRLIDERIGVPVKNRKDFSAISLKMQEDGHRAVKDTAMEDLFPNRGDTPMPCPVAAGELAGKYHYAGYGTLLFAEVPCPDAQKGEVMLEAARRDAFVPMRIRLVPATGLHWLAYMKPVDEDENALSLTMRAEFKVGIDGRVNSHAGHRGRKGLV